MPDLQEVFRVSTQKVHPEQGALERQHRRQRRSARNRKAGAFVLVAVVMAGLATVVLLTRTTTQQPAGHASTAPFVTTAPIGPQLVGTDGTPRRQFAGVPAGAEAIRLSPDGSTIAYVYGGEVGTVSADGTDQRLLTHDPNSNDGDGQNTISWSPDGSQLAFALSGNIYVMNADGSERRRLTSTTPGMGNYYPAWSPDGSTIAFWRGSDSGADGGPPDADIYTVPAKGGVPTRLTRGQGSDYEPAWSPDGSQIVFRHDHALRVMNADGTHAHDVGSFRNGPWAPAWSPNGMRIALLEYDPSERALDGGPLLRVLVVSPSTGHATDLGVRVETDQNGVQWVSNDVLLINRYD